MKISRNHFCRQAALVLAMVIAAAALVFAGAGFTPVSAGPLLPTPWPDGSFTVVDGPILADGTQINEMIINGPSSPPPDYETRMPAVAFPAGFQSASVKTLEVPAAYWLYGCSAVSGGMIAGYYDRNGWPDIYTGPANGGVYPLVEDDSWARWSDGFTNYPGNPLVASKNGLDGRTTRGSIDDYWIKSGNTGPDPFIVNKWTEHTYGEAIGDYMWTSQSTFGRSDGSTSFSFYNSASQLSCDTLEANGSKDGNLGRRNFYEAKGYTVTTCYNQRPDTAYPGGFSFAQYKAEIDANRPVMLHLTGHTVVGVGYDTTNNTVFLHDTWSHTIHSMPWAGKYDNRDLILVSIANLGVKISGNAGSPYARLSYNDNGLKEVIADAKGDYSLWVSLGWSGTVTPSLAGFVFSPVSRTYTSVQAAIDSQNYTVTPLVNISGATDVAFTRMSYFDGTDKAVYADYLGDYTISVPKGWSGTVTPSVFGYIFSPASRAYSNLQASVSGQRYIPTALIQISGNAGAQGVTLSYTYNGAKKVTSDASGNYVIAVPTGWSGTVTPSKSGVPSFTPAARSYGNLAADVSWQDFDVNKLVSFKSLAAQDGYVLESSEISTVGGLVDSSAEYIRVGDNAKKRQYRSLLSFSTASLPDTAVIVSVTLKLTRQSATGSDPFATHSFLLVDIRKPFFGAAALLGLDDFAAAPGLAAAGKVGRTPVGGYYIAQLSAAGKGYVNKLGSTQLRLRFKLDDDNDGVADTISFYSGDAVTAAYRPVLQILYYIP